MYVCFYICLCKKPKCLFEKKSQYEKGRENIVKNEESKLDEEVTIIIITLMKSCVVKKEMFKMAQVGNNVFTDVGKKCWI